MNSLTAVVFMALVAVSLGQVLYGIGLGYGLGYGSRLVTPYAGLGYTRAYAPTVYSTGLGYGLNGWNGLGYGRAVVGGWGYTSPIARTYVGGYGYGLDYWKK